MSEGGRAEEEHVRASQGQTPLQAALELLSTPPAFPGSLNPTLQHSLTLPWVSVGWL